MSKVIGRWAREHEETQGHYCHLAGFEADVRANGGMFADIYDEMDILEKVALFGLVTDMLAEEGESVERLRAELSDVAESMAWASCSHGIDGDMADPCWSCEWHLLVGRRGRRRTGRRRPRSPR